MPQPSSILQKLGFDSSPSSISCETSSTLWVLLDRVKPIWADAQGDRGKSIVNRVGPLSTRFCWLRFDPTNGSIVGTLLWVRGGDVASNAARNLRLILPEAVRICWSRKLEPWVDNKQVVGEIHTWRSSQVFLLWFSHNTLWVAGRVCLEEDKFSRRRIDVLNPWIDPRVARYW